MKPLQIIRSKGKSIDDPGECVGIFLFILGLFLLITKLNHHFRWQIVYGYLFFLGWFSWTFVEYIFLGFAWRSKRTNKRESQSATFNHQYHHQHPTKIKMSVLTRYILIAGNLRPAFH